MKKLLALGLSLAMMASLSAVAFAAQPTGNIEPGTPVKTEGEGPLGPDQPGKDETWSITIPAEIVVPWNNEADSTSADAEYSVTGTLSPVSTVTVTVDDAVVTMSNTADAQYTLDAAIGGDKSISITSTGSATGKVNATVTAEQFKNSPVGAYEGTLTFTADYSAAVV